MGRLFSCVLLSIMLLPAPRGAEHAQPVFFSLLFPQLMPGMQQESAAGEAVLL